MQKTKRVSVKQENTVAKELSARVTPASGSLWGSKGDVRSKDFLVECKTTEDNHYSLTLQVWTKIRLEACRDSLRIPVMCIDLYNGKSRMAVFEEDALTDYNACEIIFTEYPDLKDFCINVDGISRKSMNVKAIPLRWVLIGKSKKPQTHIICIPWSMFLDIVKGGK